MFSHHQMRMNQNPSHLDNECNAVDAPCTPVASLPAEDSMARTATPTSTPTSSLGEYNASGASTLPRRKPPHLSAADSLDVSRTTMGITDETTVNTSSSPNAPRFIPASRPLAVPASRPIVGPPRSSGSIDAPAAAGSRSAPSPEQWLASSTRDGRPVAPRAPQSPPDANFVATSLARSSEHLDPVYVSRKEPPGNVFRSPARDRDESGVSAPPNCSSDSIATACKDQLKQTFMRPPVFPPTSPASHGPGSFLPVVSVMHSAGATPMGSSVASSTPSLPTGPMMSESLTGALAKRSSLAYAGGSTTQLRFSTGAHGFTPISAILAQASFTELEEQEMQKAEAMHEQREAARAGGGCARCRSLAVSESGSLASEQHLAAPGGRAAALRRCSLCAQRLPGHSAGRTAAAHCRARSHGAAATHDPRSGQRRGSSVAAAATNLEEVLSECQFLSAADVMAAMVDTSGHDLARAVAFVASQQEGTGPSAGLPGGLAGVTMGSFARDGDTESRASYQGYYRMSARLSIACSSPGSAVSRSPAVDPPLFALGEASQLSAHDAIALAAAMTEMIIGEDPAPALSRAPASPVTNMSNSPAWQTQPHLTTPRSFAQPHGTLARRVSSVPSIERSQAASPAPLPLHRFQSCYCGANTTASMSSSRTTMASAWASSCAVPTAVSPTTQLPAVLMSGEGGDTRAAVREGMASARGRRLATSASLQDDMYDPLEHGFRGSRREFASVDELDTLLLRSRQLLSGGSQEVSPMNAQSLVGTTEEPVQQGKTMCVDRTEHRRGRGGVRPIWHGMISTPSTRILCSGPGGCPATPPQISFGSVSALLPQGTQTAESSCGQTLSECITCAAGSSPSVTQQPDAVLCYYQQQRQQPPAEVKQPAPTGEGWTLATSLTPSMQLRTGQKVLFLVTQAQRGGEAVRSQSHADDTATAAPDAPEEAVVTHVMRCTDFADELYRPTDLLKWARECARLRDFLLPSTETEVDT